MSQHPVSVPEEGGSFASPIPKHISDVGTWGHADRNYYLFVALTFLFGFVGLDHMYLRSNDTAFKKLLLNIFGLGIWYVWDIIQVMKDGRTIRKEGLNSPFDWIRGIGRGMFVGGTSSTNSTSNKAPKEYAAPKSYFLYTLLAIGLGAFGADKFYMGNNWQGLAKVFSVFNIFLFLFGILWVVWDAVHAYFMTANVMEKGIVPPIPFNWFFGPIKSDAFKVQEVKPESQEEAKGFSFPFPSLPTIPFRSLYRELVVPILQPTVGSAISNAGRVASVGSKAAALGATALAAAPGFVADLGAQVEAQTDAAVGTTVANVQATAAQAAAARLPTGGQTGGAKDNTSGGPGPIIAGALTALLIAGGLKGFGDFFAHQTGLR